MNEISKGQEAELIVKGMASTTLPEEILKGSNYQELLKNFKKDYDRLDDLKAARRKHEERSWFGKLFNSGELKSAQLNAAELQASFSKSLGQLLIIAHAQSITLDHQQRDLQLQQQEIKKQTKRIADANETIAQQQEELGEQQGQLEKLIKDYFKLKGLTAEGAKQLIQIAKEVEGTKSSLMLAFEKQGQTFLELQRSVGACVKQQSVQTKQLDAHRKEIDQVVAEQGERLDASFAAHRHDVDQRLLKQREQLHTEQQDLLGQQQSAQTEQLNVHREQIDQAIAEQNNCLEASIANQREDVDARLLRQRDEFHATQKALKQQQEDQFDQQRQFIESQLTESQQRLAALQAKTAMQIAAAKRLAIIGLCGVGATFLWLLWEHRAVVGL